MQLAPVQFPHATRDRFLSTIGCGPKISPLKNTKLAILSFLLSITVAGVGNFYSSHLDIITSPVDHLTQAGRAKGRHELHLWSSMYQGPFTGFLRPWMDHCLDIPPTPKGDRQSRLQ